MSSDSDKKERKKKSGEHTTNKNDKVFASPRLYTRCEGDEGNQGDEIKSRQNCGEEREGRAK